MKHLFTFFAVAILFVGLAPSVLAYDFSYTSGGKTLYYNLVNGNAEVTYQLSDGWYGAYPDLNGSLSIPSTVRYNNTTYSVTSIGSRAFWDCTGLTSITIPNSVTSIGGSAFWDCTGLTSVTIPNSVTSIGNCAFYGSTSLTSIAIPNSVTSIGNCAFKNCTGLTSVTIPNAVTSIEYSTFEGCRGLTSVTISNSITSIGDGAFKGCTNLISVTIPNSVTAIGAYAFSGCSSLTSVTIPNSVNVIPTYTFRGCTGLTSVTIPNSVTAIGPHAFSGCSSLNAVYYKGDIAGWCNIDFKGQVYYSNPSSIYVDTSISNPLIYAHNLYINNSLATNVVIPSSVTKIKKYAFYGCSSIRNLNISSSVSRIDTCALFGCSGLREIHFLRMTPPEYDNGPITRVSPTTSGVSTPNAQMITIYYPCGAEINYRNLRWFGNNFKEYIEDCGGSQGINDASDSDVKIYSRGNDIVIESAYDTDALVYDIMGHIVYHGRIDNPIHIDNNGIYLVKLGDSKPKKIVVVR